MIGPHQMRDFLARHQAMMGQLCQALERYHQCRAAPGGLKSCSDEELTALWHQITAARQAVLAMQKEIEASSS